MELLRKEFQIKIKKINEEHAK